MAFPNVREVSGSCRVLCFACWCALSAVAELKVRHWGDHCASVLLGNSSVSAVWNSCAMAWCKILWACELNTAKTNSITQQLMDLNSWMPSNYIRREVCVPVYECMCVCVLYCVPFKVKCGIFLLDISYFRPQRRPDVCLMTNKETIPWQQNCRLNNG